MRKVLHRSLQLYVVIALVKGDWKYRTQSTSGFSKCQNADCKSNVAGQSCRRELHIDCSTIKLSMRTSY